MTLTMDTGPFGHRPADRFNVEIPVGQVLFVDPLRARSAAATVIDSPASSCSTSTGCSAGYFPRDDIRWDPLSDVEPVALVGDTVAGSQSGTRVPKGILAGPTRGL